MLSIGVFRRLAFVTALFAYLQIALGGVVRTSGSGLGCPDWPLCNGRPYPPANVHSIIEYSHRLVGSITELLIVVTVVTAWIVFRRSRPAVAWLATAALAAGLSEAVLGGIVVENELAPWMVLFHLGLAMIILGLLLATAVMSMPATQGTTDRKLWVAAAATYALVLTGSTVVASRADESCHSWPACGNGFALDFTGVNAFTMLHRGAVLVVGLFLIYVLVTALRSQALRPVAIATLLVFLLQVAVGAGAAITNAGLFDGLHVAIATLVWAGVLSLGLLTLPRTDHTAAYARLAAGRAQGAGTEKRPA